MIDELQIETQKEIRSLRILMEWRWRYASPEERDVIIDQLKYDISEIVLTILIREDKDRINYFITNK